MQQFFRIFSLMSVVLKRTLAQPWLALAALLGLILASALAIRIPLYAYATYHRIFRDNLQEEDGAQHAARPPVVMLFHYPTGEGKPAEWAELERLDSYLMGNQPATTIGLPPVEQIRYIRTAELPLFTHDETSFSSQN